MTTRDVLAAVVAIWAYGVSAGLPALAQQSAEAGSIPTDSSPAKRSFTNRVWVQNDVGDDRPGVIRTFLSDGTLIQDSCWETYRLSVWHSVAGDTVTWSEDGVQVTADIVSVSADSLVLNLQLVGGETREERYSAAKVPFVCPDLPR